MKRSATMTLALALAAGLAGAAAAQTAAPNGATSPQTAAPGYPQSPAANATQPQRNAMESQATARPPANAAQPQAGPGIDQPGYAQRQPNAEANPNATLPPATSQAAGGASPEVRQAQAQLRAAGLYKGPEDGVMDPDTRMAIANFQQQHGLPRTETLDQSTVAQLTSSRPADQTTGFGSSAGPAEAPAPAGSTGAAQAPIGAGGNTMGQPAPARHY